MERRQNGDLRAASGKTEPAHPSRIIITSPRSVSAELDAGDLNLTRARHRVPRLYNPDIAHASA